MEPTGEQSSSFRSPERWNSVPVPARVARRAYERVVMGVNGCWISTYSCASHGYAQVGWYDRDEGRTRMVLAHRASWVHLHGQMSLGMTIDHLCKTRRCVNPDHLRMLPNHENARRINGSDFPLGGCRNGHSNANLIPIKRRTKSGKPRLGLTCGICLNESKRKWLEDNPDKRRRTNGRRNWRVRHPDEPMPEHLLLESERKEP